MKVIKINAIWCSGCLSMKKIWKEIEEEYPNLDITDLDYDMDEEEVNKYNPGDILPVIIFKKNENEIRLIGERTKAEIIEKIKEINE
ncbi:MAG: thioredoxin family protein [Bacilli bacterium]|nr:thioredoxin family protein [Bacilli bacterium]